MKIQDVPGYTTLEACPWCQGAFTHREIVAHAAPYLSVGPGEEVPIPLNLATIAAYRTCATCGLASQTPRLTDEMVDKYYASGFYRASLGIDPQRMELDEIFRAGLTLSHLKVNHIRPTHLLDFGSSKGHLVEAARKEFGCKAQGFDYNNGYNAETFVDDWPSGVDLITCIHVLEHTTRPWEIVARLARSTKRWLILEVPGEHTKGGPYRFAHLYVIPPELLVKWVEAAGCGMRIEVSHEFMGNHLVIAKKAKPRRKP